ncbi:uncharacterized protein BDZ83DRAFT_617680 [Colletotrichum acutatum]|uniref:Uncharacterized protein n=1 Tax=Glomerella acutata TaxID=27357 RepID=A0AAD8UNE8_GLOAC|nr:uncharacterized protein BDZ83DRAFT_617680 [Colletotrichum acutatum]KAK1726022.1 hypothetical protein BDZ83DRAFT_617680 [Colletotrichum acutatum]
MSRHSEVPGMVAPHYTAGRTLKARPPPEISCPLADSSAHSAPVAFSPSSSHHNRPGVQSAVARTQDASTWMTGAD